MWLFYFSFFHSNKIKFFPLKQHYEYNEEYGSVFIFSKGNKMEFLTKEQLTFPSTLLNNNRRRSHNIAHLFKNHSALRNLSSSLCESDPQPIYHPIQ